MINKNEWLTVGLITSCHGINGQVKVKSLSDFEERFLKPGMRWLQKENETPSKIELINLEVKTKENDELKQIGKVINLENEKNNLLVIELFKNQKKVLVPFVEEIVPLVDIKNNFLIINPPNGLLEL